MTKLTRAQSEPVLLRVSFFDSGNSIPSSSDASGNPPKWMNGRAGATVSSGSHVVTYR